MSHKTLFVYDEDLDKAVRADKLWENDDTYFKEVMVSSAACLKMMNHSLHGVEKGKKQNGMPIEIMGLLLGRPANEGDGVDSKTIIILDALPLPIEGTETRVLANDDDVLGYMINLTESLEVVRKDKVIGWYHSHPFDFDQEASKHFNNSFLSGVDISTQWAWQKAEDRNGNPWVALVVDPLTSLARNQPIIESFRVKFNSSSIEVSPLGEKVTDKNKEAIIKRWGEGFNGYSCLKTSYFTSEKGKSLLESRMTVSGWLNTFLESGKNAFTLEEEAEELDKLHEISKKATTFINNCTSKKIFMSTLGWNMAAIDTDQQVKKQRLSERAPLNQMNNLEINPQNEEYENELLEISKSVDELIKQKEAKLNIFKTKLDHFETFSK